MASMGICKFCSKKTTWLSSAHAECSRAALAATAKLMELAGSIFDKEIDPMAWKIEFMAVEAGGRFDRPSASLLKADIIATLSRAASKRSEDDPMDFSELRVRQKVLTDLLFWPSPNEIAASSLFGFALVELGGVLCEVRRGLIPQWDEPIRIDFNLQSDELPIFRAGCTDLAEHRRASQRSYQSVSIPIGGGLRYNVGASMPTTSQNLVIVDTGELLITSKSIYFGGNQEKFRISIDSVIRFEGFADAVAVYPSYGSGKVFIPHYHGARVGWFFHGLLTALASWT